MANRPFQLDDILEVFEEDPNQLAVNIATVNIDETLPDFELEQLHHDHSIDDIDEISALILQQMLEPAGSSSSTFDVSPVASSQPVQVFGSSSVPINTSPNRSHQQYDSTSLSTSPTDRKRQVMNDLPSQRLHESPHRMKAHQRPRKSSATVSTHGIARRDPAQRDSNVDISGFPLRIEMNSDRTHTVDQANTPDGLVTMVRLTRKNETTRNTVLCCRLPLKPLSNARMVRIDLVDGEIIVSHPQQEISMPFHDAKEPGFFWAKLDVHIFNSSSKGAHGYWQTQRRKTLFLIYCDSLWSIPIYIMPRGALMLLSLYCQIVYFVRRCLCGHPLCLLCVSG
jgi:hypothetical protein